MAVQLNLGCWRRVLPGFTNIDVKDFTPEVLVEDIRTLYSIEDNSVDFIYCSHVLQCLEKRSHVKVALLNWFRIMKPGGKVVIEVPNVIPLMKMYVAGFVKVESLVQGVYGVDQDGLRQTVCFNFDSLKESLNAAGFKDVKAIKQPTYSVHDSATNLVVEAEK